MKRIPIYILIVTLILFGCQKQESSLYGEWKCVTKDNTFYALTIDEDGYFSLYDIEAGNPGLQGHVKVGSSTLECVFDMDDFDPPKEWNTLKQKDILSYKLNQDLKLEYNGFWLQFVKRNK